MIKKTIQRIRQRIAPRRRAQEAGGRPHYDSSQAFDQPHYADITKAQLRHLGGLGLDIQGKSVLDVGCGIGRLSEIFDAAGCTVCCADGRAGNITRLKELYPRRRAEVLDVEKESLSRLGTFDIVFCYGLLYHVVDVAGVIEKCCAASTGLLLIETCITPVYENIVRLVWENPKDVTQALRAWGSRPSPSYIETCLRLNGFEHIYAPREMPEHAWYKYRYVKELSKFDSGTLARDIFIGSRKPLDLATVVPRGSEPKQ